MQQGPDSNVSPPAKKSNAGLIVGVVIAVIFGGVFVVGILASLAIYGVRNYLSAAKSAEGREGVSVLARDVARCAETESPTVLGGAEPGAAGLPPTTTPVPPTLSMVSGRKYQSSPSEWTTSGWDCIKFSMIDPQYFQYQWERTSATAGVARAMADLNGDGSPDVTFESPVSCTPPPTVTCTVSPTEEKH